MFRDPKPEETQTLIEIAEATGIFKPDEAQSLLGSTLSAFHRGELGENHKIKVFDQESYVVGWSYFAPSQYAEGVWDVWWIGTHPKVHGQGFGQKLLKAVEGDIRSLGGRVIIIETSSLSPLAKARKFYPLMNYKECGRIPNFYANGDDKIIFSKSIVPANT